MSEAKVSLIRGELMARFDKLTKYKEALESGMNDSQATFWVNSLSLAAEPEIDLSRLKRLLIEGLLKLTCGF